MTVLNTAQHQAARQPAADSRRLSQKAAPPSALHDPAAIDPPALRDEAVRTMIDRISDRWSILVLLALADGRRSHRDLTRLVPHVSTRVLTLTVRQLVKDGLVARVVISSEVLGNEYALSALGRSLLEPVKALLAWAEQNREALRAAQQVTIR